MKDISLILLIAWSSCVAIAALYIYLCPFTKVEESFNLQAIHDHIHHGLDVSKFDHIDFPGVIPRTFVGSVVVGYISMPIKLLLGQVPKFYLQYVVRLVLMSLVLGAFLHFTVAVKKLYGSGVAIWSCLLLCTQFHFLFYTSRPLPNSFAAIFALLASSYWLRNRPREFVFTSGFAIIVFRCELAIMFGLMLLLVILYGNVQWSKLIQWIIVTGVISLGATVLIDSYYWQRWVWPEGEAFHFNAILNKSSEWGTSPFLWYFYSALPRSMGLTLLLVPLGMALDTRCLVMSVPAFGFVFLYSLLPHKELRFIIYVVPILNVAAARACSVGWNNRRKGLAGALFCLLLLGHLLVNVAMTAVLLKVSYHNYPGGHALHYLNTHAASTEDVKVHIDIYSAQTGISRFLHEHENWSYDKTEDEKMFREKMSTYTHLIVGAPDEPLTQAITSLYSTTHSSLHTEMCYKNIQLTKQYPFIGIKLAPCVWIFEANFNK